MRHGRSGEKGFKLGALIAGALVAAACGSASSGDTGLVQLTSPGPNAQLENLGQGEGRAVAGEDASTSGGEVQQPDGGTFDDATATQDTSTDTATGPTSDAHSEDTSVEEDVTAPLDDTASTSDASQGADTTHPDDTTEPDDTMAPVDDTTPPEDTSDEDSAGDDAGPEPLCTPGTTSCEDQSIVVCDPSGELWIAVATCPTDMPCVDGVCCAPQCDGKACGDDGCGGSCGTCDDALVCDAVGNCVTPPACIEGEPCDDGDPCTTDDLCTEGACTGAVLSCEDSDPCTTDSCGPTGCVNEAITCDDADPCTADSCGVDGCVFAEKNCGDGDPCTEDSCGSQGCVNAPVTCDDEDPCTEDSCGAQGCVYTDLDCDDGQTCTADSCGPNGCVNEATACDDGDPCTTDSCGAAGCIFEPKDCDDGHACTSDSCVDGACEATIHDDSCLIDGACKSSGASADTASCLACSPTLNQTAWSPAFGAPCDDGDACTEADTCQTGVDTEVACKGASIVEDNGDPCLDVVCVAGDVWTKEVNGVACAPDDPCSATGQCLDGTCVPQAPCECYQDSDCQLDEICEEFACTPTFCGNGLCDAGDDEDCPEDCAECPSASWCPNLCLDPITANPACTQSCCGDGFCALSESATCCPEDCSPQMACEAATSVDTVPTTIEGNTYNSNAALETDTDQCDTSAWTFGQGFGEGREDVIAFTAPFTGTFVFQLEGPWNSQVWFFDDCNDAAGSCITTGPEVTGLGSISELDMEAGSTVFVAVDAISIYFGAGPYTLIIDGLCAPDCSGKQCGDDGCGGTCGTCNDASLCSATGDCLNASEVCNYHLDCEHNEVCGWWPTDELNRCSALCKGPTNCFANQICERVPGSAHVAYCRAKTDKADIGEPCTDSESCDSGICAKAACREACISQKGCQGSDICRKLTFGTTVTSACVPPDDGLGQTACGSCDSQHCDVFSDSLNAVCADICVTTSDCTDDQACYLVDHSADVNPATVPYHPTYPNALNDAVMGCFTHPDGLGDKDDGESCSASAQCSSGICLPIAADGGFYCTRPCYKNSSCDGDMLCRLTGINLVSTYLPEVGLGDPGAFSLVRLCDFPSGVTGGE